MSNSTGQNRLLILFLLVVAAIVLYKHQEGKSKKSKVRDYSYDINDINDGYADGDVDFDDDSIYSMMSSFDNTKSTDETYDSLLNY